MQNKAQHERNQVLNPSKASKFLCFPMDSHFVNQLNEVNT